MGPGMEAWLLIMILALILILPAMLALLWRGRVQTGLEPKAKRKRRAADFPGEETLPDRDELIRLGERGMRWLEDDGELPELTPDDLYLGEKPKRSEDDE